MAKLWIFFNFLVWVWQSRRGVLSEEINSLCLKQLTMTRVELLFFIQKVSPQAFRQKTHNVYFFFQNQKSYEIMAKLWIFFKFVVSVWHPRGGGAK